MSTLKQGDLFGRTERLVGGYVPTHLADLLDLIALYEDSSRTALIIKMAEDKIKLSPTVDKMVDQLAYMALNKWGSKGKEKCPFNNLIMEIRSNLQRKKIKETFIKKIIERMKILSETYYNHNYSAKTK